MNGALCRAVIAIAALLMAVATGLGAWASHELQSVLDESALRAFETAVTYQFVHALGLIGVGILGPRYARSALAPGAAILLAGVLLFCGGLYASSLGGPAWLSSVAPAGGIGLILGWIAIGAGVLLGGERGSDT